MRLEIEVESQPFFSMGYQNVAQKGWVTEATLPFHRAVAPWLPADLDGLVITGDLQGMVTDPGTGLPALLGLAVVQQLVDLHLDGFLPPPSRLAALLAGDFFALPDRRGGFGCVAEVWQAFASEFARVVGVAGNHDDVSRISRSRAVHLLDGSCVNLGALSVGGVGRIMGNARKPGRREEEEQRDALVALAESRPDIVLLHEGPPGEAKQPGHALVGEIIESHEIPLTICGHKHWAHPVCRKAHGTLLNVHERVLVLQREPAPIEA